MKRFIFLLTILSIFLIPAGSVFAAEYRVTGKNNTVITVPYSNNESVSERQLTSDRSHIILFKYDFNGTPENVADDKLTNAILLVYDPSTNKLEPKPISEQSRIAITAQNQLTVAERISFIANIEKGILNKAGTITDPNAGYSTGYQAELADTNKTGNGTPLVVEDGDKGECSIGISTTFSWEACARGVGELILKGMSFFLAVAGTALDLAIKITIQDAHTYLSAESLDRVWKTLRDLCNLIFIFVLLEIAIRTILGDGSRKKLIAKVIVAALLINMSMFFVKIAVDVSNVITVKFYNAIVTTNSLSIVGVNVTGLSTAYMDNLSLTKIYNSNTANPKGTIGTWGIVVSTFLGSIFFLIAAFVFMAFAVMLIIRFVVIVLLMVVSPLAIVGSILPSMKSMVSDKFWKELTAQCLFAPAFMILAWVTLQISKGISTGLNADKAITTDVTSLAFQFIIMIAFMIASLVVAKSTSSTGSAIATKWGGKVSFGMAGAIGRNTIGRAASSLAGSDRFKDLAAQNKFGVGRMLYKGTKSLGGAGFDARDTSTFKGAGSLLGADFGKSTAPKGGYKGSVEARAKEHMAFAKDLGDIDKDDLPSQTKQNIATLQLAVEQRKNFLKNNNPAHGSEERTAAEKEIKDKEKLIGTLQNPRQESYAARIEKEGKLAGLGYLAGKWGSSNAKNKAAKDIRKAFKKSKEKEILEALKKQMKDDEKASEEKSGGDDSKGTK